VATDAPGAREVLGDNDTGNIVPLGDGEALAAAVVERFARPEQAAAEGAANRRRAEAEFDRERTYTEMAALTLEIVSRRQRPAPPG
jgi:glycosyltransferase involved in cell wall biosynthesis